MKWSAEADTILSIVPNIQSGTQRTQIPYLKESKNEKFDNCLEFMVAMIFKKAIVHPQQHCMD